MRVVLFYQSIVSDWNHGNAHFLRGVVRELQARGHEAVVYEPRTGWSRTGLLRDGGERALGEFRETFPTMAPRLYDLDTIDVAEAVDGASLVLVHEWNDPWLVAAIGRARRGARFRLLFHDTHHRLVTAPAAMERYDLADYDGVLAYGRVLVERYLERGWTERAWTWHEAADVALFRPLPEEEREGDLVWIGNWGDDERTAELDAFLLEPVRKLSLRGSVYGVRYPDDAVRRIERAGLRYRSWLPNHRAPEAFARHRVTVHVPRRPYVEALPGIPTIRPFEALACAIPLVCSPWDDVERLFTAGDDYLVARNGDEMRTLLDRVLRDGELARHLVQHGRQTILTRHTCAHRVDELLAIAAELGVATTAEERAAARSS